MLKQRIIYILYTNTRKEIENGIEIGVRSKAKQKIKMKKNINLQCIYF